MKKLLAVVAAIVAGWLLAVPAAADGGDDHLIVHHLRPDHTGLRRAVRVDRRHDHEHRRPEQRAQLGGQGLGHAGHPASTQFGVGERPPAAGRARANAARSVEGMFGGIWFPIDASSPDWLRVTAHGLPTYWITQITRAPLTHVWPAAGGWAVLAVWVAVGARLAARGYRRDDLHTA